MPFLKKAQRDKLQRLGVQAKNTTLFGTREGKPLGEYLSKEIDQTLEWDANVSDQELKDVYELYATAYSGDRGAVLELQSIRIEQTQNYLIPALHFGRFFEIVTLAPHEVLGIQNNTKNEFTARYIGQDGGKEKAKAVPIQTEEVIPLFPLVTDEVEYTLVDINTGNVADAAKATFDLNFDLENKLDANLYTLLEGSFGSFVTTGKKSNRTYNLNSRIRSGIVPTTNDLDAFGTVDGNSTFGQNTLDAIVDYCGRWPKDAEGELRPTGEILIPADNLYHVGTGVTITGQMQNKQAQQIADTGWYGFHYNGIDWKFIPDHTIPAKKCIPQLNRPVGKLAFKPAMDKDVEKVDEANNVGTRFIRKIVAMTVPTPNKKNIVRVRYQT